ncbi:MAG: extracellular solute-binding protein [Acholeplasmataceae bacterium]|nr:extracellular solute-binding protein [Acholeplasmataceae bacterium]
MRQFKLYFSFLFVLLIGTFLVSCVENELTLSFDSNGGSMVQSISTDGKSVTLPNAPTKEGFTFDGWFWDNDTFQDPVSIPIAASHLDDMMTVYAKWVPIQVATSYTITFDSTGGSPVAPITAYYEDQITEPTNPTMEGFAVFEGWYLDPELSEPFVFNTMPDHDLTLYAKWNNTLVLSTDPIEITLWHAEKSTNTAYLEAYATEFMALYPNITVHIATGSSSYDRVKQDVLSAVFGNTTLPNLVQGTSEHMAEYIYHDLLLNLDPFQNNSVYGLIDNDSIDDIIPSFVEECSQYDANHSLYALPFAKTTEIMIYNQTAFNSIGLNAPQTWQEIETLDTSLKTYGSQFNNLNQIVSATYESTSNLFSTFIKQYGGAYTSLDFDTMTGQALWVDQADSIAAMNFIKDNKAFITIPDYWDESYASTPFIEQKTFIVIASSSDIRYYMPPIDTLTGLPTFIVEAGIVPYNSDVLDSQFAIQRGTDLGLLDTGTIQEQLASWLFLKFLTSTEINADWSMKTGYLPVRSSVYGDPDYIEFLNHPTTTQFNNSLVAHVIAQQINYMFFEPAFMNASLVRTKVGIAIERIILGDGNIEEALEEASS